MKQRPADRGRSGRTGVLALLVSLSTALTCVTYDSTRPAVPTIAGTYVGTVITSIENSLEIRSDTFAATLILREAGAFGRFAGSYRVAASDSGPFNGQLNPDGSFTLSVFGDPPKPIAGVRYIRELYAWCELPILGIAQIAGSLGGDSLAIQGHGSVACHYQLAAGTVVQKTELYLLLIARR